MINFDIGETVICSIKAKQLNILKDPDSLQITIYDPAGVIDVGPVGMSRDSAGNWHYDYATTSKVAGSYRAQVKGTSGARVFLVNGSFKLR